MVVALKTGTSFARGTPTPLFHTDSPLADYDVAPVDWVMRLVAPHMHVAQINPVEDEN
jgi:hypothetical protein